MTRKFHNHTLQTKRRDDEEETQNTYLKLIAQLYIIVGDGLEITFGINHTGKCIRRFGGIYAYCRYFIDRKW